MMNKSTFLFCALVLTMSGMTATPVLASGPAIEVSEQTRGLVDFVVNSFGLEDVWDLIQHVGSNVTAPLLQLLTQILFKGQTAINQAKIVITKLIITLKSTTVNSSQAVAQAISDLAAILAGNPNSRALLEANRGLFDYVINLFGLGDIWSTIQGVGAEMVSNLLSELVQVLLRGKGAIDQAKPIIANMIQEIKDHSIGKVQAVAQAISDLAAILAGNPNSRALLEANRGLFDYVINLFGLGDVWSSVQGVGSQLVAKLLNELVQIILRGKGAIDLAKPIIANMIQEIKDHSVSSYQAVFQAISDLAAILAGNPNSRALLEANRGLFDYVINLFGLGDIWSTIQGAGSDLVGTLVNELLQIVMKGKGLVDQAKPVIAKLIDELKTHSVTSAQAVAEAVSDLAAILAGNQPSPISA